MANKKLEEIFWKEGKFVNKNGDELKPEPIGLPFQVMNLEELPISEKYLLETKSKKINGYSKTSSLSLENMGDLTAIQFYKI